jgi:type IV pilus assembly protein PilB
MAATARTQGLILITGPTSSGKTNTLYAALAEGVDRKRNVITLEDPVEIELPGITQVQVDDRIGMTFARGLRAALRQDPDVILVGEVRDQETAELAVRASLTGHLVLATLHTTDAAAAVTRLSEMGVAPYLVASSLILVVSQRLVRVPCTVCSIADPDAPALNAPLPGSPPHDPPNWLASVGCPTCSHTGYTGRTAIVELLPITREIRTGLLRRADEDDVRASARSAGMDSLFAVGVQKARSGETTMTEVLRAVPRELVSADEDP